MTYGDANDAYDQSAGIAPVVRDEQVHAKAVGVVPSLGVLRLGVDAAVARFGPLPGSRSSAEPERCWSVASATASDGNWRGERSRNDDAPSGHTM